VAVEATLIGYRCARHRVFKPLNGAHVAGTCGSVRCLGAVLLHQCLELGFACIQGAREVQGYVSVMACMGLAEFPGPIVKQLPFVGSLFWHLNRVFLHICCAIGNESVPVTLRRGSNTSEDMHLPRVNTHQFRDWLTRAGKKFQGGYRQKQVLLR